MKINFILTLLSLFGAALLAYLFYTLAGEEGKLLNVLTVSGFVSIVCCLEIGIGISWENARRKVNAFAVSSVFFIIFAIEHCCFALWGEEQSWIIITTGLILILYLIIVYGISKAKM